MTDLFSAVKELARLPDELARRGIHPTRNGMYNCPFPDHKDSTPSFHIYSNTNSGYCHGCQRGGDVIRIIALIEGISDLEAAQRLAHEFGIQVDERFNHNEYQYKALQSNDVGFVRDFIQDVNNAFLELCRAIDFGQYVLDAYPPEMKKDGSVVVSEIYNSYVHQLPIWEHMRDSLTDALNGYDHAVKRDNEAFALEALESILEIYNYVRGYDFGLSRAREANQGAA